MIEKRMDDENKRMKMNVMRRQQIKRKWRKKRIELWRRHWKRDK
jgi:hypothetical protein